VQQQIVLTFMDGEQAEGVLARPFAPKENEIAVTLAEAGEGMQLSYPLYDLACIKLVGTPSAAAPTAQEIEEEIETVTGEKFHVSILTKEKYSLGFYGLPLAKTSHYKSIFFTFHGIKKRNQDRLLGSILEEQGLVDRPTMQRALEDQKKLRNRRLGEIIVQQNNFDQTDVERILSDARSSGEIPRNARIGDILVAAGLVSRAQIETALGSQQKGRKKRIGELLIEKKLITEEQLLGALAAKFRMPFIDLEQITPDPDALKALSLDVVTRLQVLPLRLRPNRHLVVAISEPTNPTIFDNLRFTTSYPVDLVVATSQQIADAIERCYIRTESRVEELIGELDEDAVHNEEENDDSAFSESDSQIINLVNKVLIDAYKKGVSDIHIEPGIGRQTCLVRYRVDGVCHVMHRIAAAYKNAIVARIKIMARLDIAEHRRPQSGKILLRYEGKKIEYRLEITPTVGGNEDAVLRILASSNPLPLPKMGFSQANLHAFEEVLKKPYGIILCVGPTGSGKTTSLHSALGHINHSDRKIWTAEDPVEITQPGLRQVQVHPKIGFGFKEALRSFLRADPDVIMIGEMRDAETAKTAIEASLTGHLVFSTLHTNSAPETVVRLIEMGMDPYNFADAMLGILAQRLARRLCDHCLQPYCPSRTEYDDLVHAYGEEWFEKHGLPDYGEGLTLVKGGGCRECNGTGYRGRVAIHEMMVGTPTVKSAIKQGKSAEELRSLAIDEGMATLKMDGIQKVFQGLTDLDQVLRVCL